LFGTILFVVALFLFTTFLVYHVFFACGYFVVAVSLASIQLSYAVVLVFPFGLLLHPAAGEVSLVEKIYLDCDQARSNDLIDVSMLRGTTSRCSRVAWDSMSATLHASASSLVNSALCLVTGSLGWPVINPRSSST
jgi:hypothetical protein